MSRGSEVQPGNEEVRAVAELVMRAAEQKGGVDAARTWLDAQFKAVFDAIRELMTPAQPNRRRIGFSSH